MSASFRLLLVVAWLSLPFRPAWAGAAALPPPASMCDPAIAAAEQAFHLPPHLLEAMGRVESGRPDAATGHLEPWPWTINAEGQGAFFATKAQAIAAVRALQASGVRSIDVGCLQVNLMYHPTAFSSLDQAFDPRANAMFAARFLTALRGAAPGWMGAIAAYHSQTALRGDDYRRRVLAFWHNPAADWHLGLAAAYRDFLPRQKVYGDFAPVSSVYGAFAGAGR
jgi:soluble lytic murein transglycosylase-like protein